MNPHLAWYAARAAGIVAWGLLSASVVWGLLLSTRLLNGRPTPRWLLDLHRFLGGLAVTFTAVHVAGLVGDNYLHLGVADLLVPFASTWRPGAVALGVVGLWLLLAVEITSLLMRWLPRRLWHGVHMTSYLLFWTATLHGLLAGSDTHHLLYVLATSSVVTLVLFLTLVRVLAPPRSARTARSTPRDARTEVLPRLPATLPRHAARGPLAVVPRDQNQDRSDALARRANALATRRQPTPQQRQAVAAQRAAARSAGNRLHP